MAEGEGRWSRRVALALTTRLGTGGASFRHAADAEFEVDSGFTGLWWRETLERHGGWDEEWLNDQDFELAARIRKAGGTIVCVPAMAAGYIPRDGLGALARQYHRYGFYRVKTSLRHPESLRRSHVLAPGLVLTADRGGGGAARRCGGRPAPAWRPTRRRSRASARAPRVPLRWPTRPRCRPCSPPCTWRGAPASCAGAPSLGRPVARARVAHQRLGVALSPR